MYLKSVCGDVLYEGRAFSVRQLVEMAVQENICLDGVDLRGCNLSFSNLDGMRARQACLWGANLLGVDMAECEFQESDFRNSHLEKVCIVESNFNQCDFRGAYFSKLIINGAILSHCSFSCPSLFSIDMSFVGDLSQSVYIHEGEIECDLSNVPTVFKGRDFLIVFLRDYVLVNNKLKKIDGHKIMMNLSHFLHHKHIL